MITDNETPSLHDELWHKVQRTNALACLDCGKCTSVCPVAQFRYGSTMDGRYSPRVMLTRSVRQNFDSLFHDYDLWSCLTCRKCDIYCPANIHYMELMKHLRSGARQSGIEAGKCSHSSALQALSRIMTTKELKQNRLNWITDELEIAEEGEILYYVGCAPYFDAFFTDLQLDILDAARSSIALLNRLGISPALLPDERCCGHDLLWNGDIENFRMLAQKNVQQINNSGARTVLFSCAECMTAFQNLYPEYGFKVNAELKHMSQFLAEKISAGELELGDNSKNITFHDPCRLGRHLGIHNQPREVLTDGNGHYHEMKHNGRRSLCCGVSAWMNCDITAKAIQKERLKETRQTGAEVLAVACPKCQIHLVCTLKDPTVKNSSDINIRDISSIALDRLETADEESTVRTNERIEEVVNVE